MTTTVWTDKNGVTREYLEVKREARVGELVKVVNVIDRGSSSYYVGDVYRLNRHVDSLGVGIYDRAGKTASLWHGEYVVLEPTDIVYYDCKRYREVKREARAGELIKIVSAVSNYENYRNGDVLTVERRSNAGVLPGVNVKSAQRNGNAEGLVYDKEYVVLEPVDDDIVHYNGKKYRAVKRQAEPGHLIITTGDMEPFYKAGEIAKVKYLVRGDALCRFDTARQNHHDWHVNRHDYLVLEQVAEDNEQPAQPSIDSRITALEQKVGLLDQAIPAVVRTEMQAEIIHKLQSYGLIGVDAGLNKLDQRVFQLEQVDYSQHCESRRLIRDLTQRVAELEKRLPLGGNTFATIPAGETVFPLKKQYTREQVIELAKKDVEKLTNQVFSGSWNKSGIPAHYEHGPMTVHFVVNRKKRTVEARLVRRNIPEAGVAERATARCAPDDCFNIHIGKAIALRKALGLEVPDYYVNAPQPTEAQIGDAVNGNQQKGRIYGQDRTFILTGLMLGGSGFSYKGGGSDWIYKYQIGKIIDDSHDFGGEQS